MQARHVRSAKNHKQATAAPREREREGTESASALDRGQSLQWRQTEKEAFGEGWKWRMISRKLQYRVQLQDYPRESSASAAFLYNINTRGVMNPFFAGIGTRIGIAALMKLGFWNRFQPRNHRCYDSIFSGIGIRIRTIKMMKFRFQNWFQPWNHNTSNQYCIIVLLVYYREIVWASKWFRPQILTGVKGMLTHNIIEVRG